MIDRVHDFTREVQVAAQPATDFARAAAEAAFAVASTLGSIRTPAGFMEAVLEAGQRMAEEA